MIKDFPDKGLCRFIDAMPQACILLDRKSRILHYNSEIPLLFELERKEDFISRLKELFPERQPDGMLSMELILEKIAAARKNGHSRYDFMHSKLNGDPIPTEVNIIRCEYRRRFFCLMYITDLREFKVKLNDLYKIMEDLRIARNASEQNARSKLNFFASMSHEIRTPLNAILGISELLLDEKLTPKQYEYVNDIKKSSDILLSIVNDILDFSKLESGKFELICKKYNFKLFLDNIVSTAQFLARDKELDFSMGVEGEIPEYIHGDEDRLAQVLWNIIGNAIKYTREGWVHLRVTGLPKNLRFDITDTGVGIRSEDLPQLFTAFTQVDREKNRRIKGTGLGLTISKNFVELMGGTIGVVSVYGKGSTFSVTIPKVVVEDRLETDDQDTVPSEYGFFSECAAKILVVDDNAINLRVAEGMFNSLGLSIQTAQSGFEAVNMVRNVDYDIVFMDHMMPDFDGIETTDTIRKLGKKYETLPIIALTANAIQGVKEMFLKSGMNDFISKPVDKRALSAILRKWLPPNSYVLTDFPAGTSLPAARIDNALKKKLTEGFPELNITIGLARIGENWNAYCKLLEVAARTIPANCVRLDDYIRSRDISHFLTEVHGLKGSLLSMGAIGLADRALLLENAARASDIQSCTDGAPVLIADLRDFSEKLSLLFKEKQKKGFQSRKTGNADMLRIAVTEAKSAVEEYDVDKALQLLEDLRKFSFPRQTEESLQHVRNFLDEFNYTAAISVLNKLLSQ